jgi:ATP-dependent helicase HrpB
MVQTPLPMDAHVGAIVEHVRRAKSAVIVAPPGSGKTTRIPPALTSIGRTILLQPRRVAARALARRIAAERGWTIGEEIGWQIRAERRFSPRTRLLVATEGILTARLQCDPLLSDFDVVVLDEFHERSIHADLALALVRQAARARSELAIVVMSATLDAGEVSRFLGGARMIEIDARRFPVDVSYRPGASVREIVQTTEGDVLCFLPGVREIERTANELAGVDALVLALHGRLEVDAQERALAPATRRKVILATNVAETSLTVEGVTDVIDSGLHRVLRFDPETAVDHLVTERISVDSAEQRAGRAGRTRPGRAFRLWDERDILRPHREPEVRRVDLAAPVLDVIRWGGDPKTFEWFERPPEERIDAAIELLRELDARSLPPMPLHPRLARVLVAAHGADEAIEWCARLADVTPAELVPIARRITGYRQHADPQTVRRALLAGYPDRVGMRREKGSPRLLLATGTGATLAREADVHNADFVVALEVTGDLVRAAEPVERDWLTPTRREVVHEWNGDRVRAVERVWYLKLLLREQQVPADPSEAARILAKQAHVDPVLLRRARFAGVNVDWDALLQQAALGKTRAADIHITLPFDLRRKLDALAPPAFKLPSGREVKLDYREDGSVVASAKLQELFGLAETPRIGPHKTPITFALLAPSGRPVQITQDLRSFWNTTYAEVRKELRGRYPKHKWPEDPWKK